MSVGRGDRHRRAAVAFRVREIVAWVLTTGKIRQRRECGRGQVDAYLLEGVEDAAGVGELDAVVDDGLQDDR